MICRREKPISSSGTAMAGGGGDVDSLLLGSDRAADSRTEAVLFSSTEPSALMLPCRYSQVPVLFCVLVGWESGEVRLCLRPTSSDGDVGREDTGGVWARRVGTRVVG